VTLTIELPENLEAALKAQAHAHGLSEAGYIRSMLERDLAASANDASQPLAVAPTRKNLAQLFAESPFKGLNMEFDESENEKDFGRDIHL
jgi:plasmid stability protein